jgi:hypothetical protein
LWAHHLQILEDGVSHLRGKWEVLNLLILRTPHPDLFIGPVQIIQCQSTNLSDAQKLSKGKTVYAGKRLSLAEMRRMGRKEWRRRFPGPTFFITGKDKGKLGYFWEHVYLKAKSGPNLGGVVNPDSGVAILDSEMQKLTALDFTDKLKVSEALTAARGGTTRFSALWH